MKNGRRKGNSLMRSSHTEKQNKTTKAFQPLSAKTRQECFKGSEANRRRRREKGCGCPGRRTQLGLPGRRQTTPGVQRSPPHPQRESGSGSKRPPVLTSLSLFKQHFNVCPRQATCTQTLIANQSGVISQTGLPTQERSTDSINPT